MNSKLAPIQDLKTGTSPGPTPIPNLSEVEVHAGFVRSGVVIHFCKMRIHWDIIIANGGFHPPIQAFPPV